jgi:cell division protein FtsW
MAKRVGVDKWLFGTVLTLVLFGLVMVFSASAVMAQETMHSPYAFVDKQAVWALLGMVALLGLMKIDYRRYNNRLVIFTVMGATAVLLAAVFAMHKMNGAHRWVRLGGFSLEPSELAKPVIVLFLAWFLQTRIHRINDVKSTILPAVIPPLLYIGLILKEPDLGTALVCAAVVLLMLFLAGMQMKWIGVGVLCAAPLLYYMLWMVPWRRARMEVFLHPELDPKGAGFNILQSLIAVGSGGWHGRGLMEGVQKLFYLPEPHTDFIFANVCEELGLLGALCVVVAFCLLGYRGLRAAYLSTDPFARFLAFGLTTAILVQALFNMSVVLALLPTKGIALPFVSSGGTSVFVTLACMGVLLNVTREID